LSDLERFGLAALGALAVRAILKNGDQVVSNTGDRVVVEDDTGEFRVLKDDYTLLRQPGARLRTETFNDGSTRSMLARDDGSSMSRSAMPWAGCCGACAMPPMAANWC